MFRDGADFVVGRKEVEGTSLDLTLDDRRVSRTHARIINVDGAFHLVDESSRGSYVVHSDGEVEAVLMNVSRPLIDLGDIFLGDPPGVDASTSLKFRVVAP